MQSNETRLMQKRAQWYLDYVRNEAEECVNRKIGYKIESCDFEKKELTLCFETEDWMMNPGGVLHGGMISTMFDICMGITALSVSGFFTPTVNLSVSFLSPVPNHDRLIITAHATRVGRTFIQLTAQAVSTLNKELSATATGIFFCGNQEKLNIDLD